MWIINLLPDWFFYSLIGIGLIGFGITYLLRFIPLPVLYIYKTPIQIISVALVVIGTFMVGALMNDNAWKAKVAELEKQVAEAKAQSEKINTETIVKYVTKREVIRQKGEEIVKYIDREIVKHDNSCKLPPDVISLHNNAAKEVK